MAAGEGARAGEVRPGGYPDLTIAGFVGILAHGGQLDDLNDDPELSRQLDFSTDVEVHVLARAADERTGLEYGGTIEFMANTNTEENADQTWLFVRGGFGELRFGDVDGPVDNSVLGASTIAAGTGGIDGDVVDAVVVDAVQPSTSDDATKIRYYTPTLAGFQLGVSYTPSQAVINSGEGQGDSLALQDADARDWVEAALVYEAELDEEGDSTVEASLLGSWGQIENKASDSFDGRGRGRLWAWYLGANASLVGWSVGAGYGQEDVGGLQKRYFNTGVGAELGPVNLSLTYGQVLSAEHYAGVGRPWNLVLSADTALAEGLTLAGDISRFDNDIERAERAAGGDRGWAWVARVEVAF